MDSSLFAALGLLPRRALPATVSTSGVLKCADFPPLRAIMHVPDCILLVGKERVELSIREALVSKTSVYTIPPLTVGQPRRI
jgi:hypothetical protein